MSTLHIILHLVRHIPTKSSSDNQHSYNIYIYIYIYIYISQSFYTCHGIFPRNLSICQSLFWLPMCASFKNISQKEEQNMQWLACFNKTTKKGILSKTQYKRRYIYIQKKKNDPYEQQDFHISTFSLTIKLYFPVETKKKNQKKKKQDQIQEYICTSHDYVPWRSTPVRCWRHIQMHAK